MQLANAGSLNEPSNHSPRQLRGSRFAQVAGAGSDYLAHRTGSAPVGPRNSFDEIRHGQVHLGVGATMAIAGGGSADLFEHLERHSPAYPSRLTADVLQSATLGALSGGQTTPYLAVVRNLLDQDQIGAARDVLDAVPLELLSRPVMQRLKRLLAPPRVTVSAHRDADRTREYSWLRDHWQAHRGQWVALEGDRLVASARSLKELRERLFQLQSDRPPLIHHLQ